MLTISFSKQDRQVRDIKLILWWKSHLWKFSDTCNSSYKKSGLLLAWELSSILLFTYTLLSKTARLIKHWNTPHFITTVCAFDRKILLDNKWEIQEILQNQHKSLFEMNMFKGWIDWCSFQLFMEHNYFINHLNRVKTTLLVTHKNRSLVLFMAGIRSNSTWLKLAYR